MSSSKAPQKKGPAPDGSDVPVLSFSASHYAKLDPEAFLAELLPSTRPSGRSPSESRPIAINSGSLSHTNGSAVVRVGDTAVVCGVQAEILDAKDANVAAGAGAGDRQARSSREEDPASDAETIAELSLLVPNIEVATGCHPAYPPGNAPTSFAQSLAHRLLTLLQITNLVGLESLRIWDRASDRPSIARDVPGDDDDDDDDDSETTDAEPTVDRIAAYWTLYIDMLVISLDGGAFDAAWGSLLAALANTRLPMADWDSDRGDVVCDPLWQNGHGLVLRHLPIALSFGVFVAPGERVTNDDQIGTTDTHVLVDLDDFEEGQCSETATIVVDGATGTVWRIEKDGGDVIDMEMTKQLIHRTAVRWKEWNTAIESSKKSE